MQIKKYLLIKLVELFVETQSKSFYLILIGLQYTILVKLLHILFYR